MKNSRGALVTGAGQGIGRAIALQLAEDGFNVALGDLPSQREKLEGVSAEIRAWGRTAVPMEMDVSRREQVFSAVARASSELGSFDVMINNAGIVQVQPFENITEAELRQILDVNVNSVIWGIQAAVQQFEADGKHKGKILSAASLASFSASPSLAAYSATKFAVRGLTQAAAQEFGPRNITVNAYSPGAVETDMQREIDERHSSLKSQASGEYKNSLVGRIALGRLEKPADVANLVSFLASDKADYITGQTLAVDGGMHRS